MRTIPKLYTAALFLAVCQAEPVLSELSTTATTNATGVLDSVVRDRKEELYLNINNSADVTVNDPEYWRKPCIVDWKDGRIWFGGIQARQIESFCVWSMDDAELLWFLKSARRDDYTRRSRTSSVILEYGEPPLALKQLYPKSHSPRNIKENEVVNAHFTWAFMSLVGQSSDQQFYYFRKVGDEFISIPLDDIEAMGYDLVKTAELQRRMYFLVMTGGEYPENAPPGTEKRGRQGQAELGSAPKNKETE